MSNTIIESYRRLRPLFYLFILGAIWGLHFSLIKLAAESDISYNGIVAVTTLGAAIALFLVAIVRRKFPVWNLQHVKFYLICALLGYVMPFFLELYCAANLPASVLTLIASNSPIFTVMIALIVRSDTFSKRQAFAITVGCLSALIILIPASLGQSDISTFWATIALSIPLIYAAYHNYVSKAWPQESDSFQVASGEAILALILLLPIFLFRGNLSGFSDEWGYEHLAISVMIIFVVVEVFLYFEIVKLAGPIFVSQASYVTVVTGVLWGILIFNESMSVWIALSAILLAIALYFSNSIRGR